jgi:hypothetical protein
VNSKSEHFRLCSEFMCFWIVPFRLVNDCNLLFIYSVLNSEIVFTNDTAHTIFRYMPLPTEIATSIAFSCLDHGYISSRWRDWLSKHTSPAGRLYSGHRIHMIRLHRTSHRLRLMRAHQISLRRSTSPPPPHDKSAPDYPPPRRPSAALPSSP